jgi:hypothetical protein
MGSNPKPPTATTAQTPLQDAAFYSRPQEEYIAVLNSDRTFACSVFETTLLLL